MLTFETLSDKLEASLILSNRNCDHRRVRERETLDKLNLRGYLRHIFSLSPSNCYTTSDEKGSPSTMFPHPIPPLVPQHTVKISAINIYFATKSNGQICLLFTWILSNTDLEILFSYLLTSVSRSLDGLPCSVLGHWTHPPVHPSCAFLSTQAVVNGEKVDRNLHI